VNVNKNSLEPMRNYHLEILEIETKRRGTMMCISCMA
jgi:hypothetical protein